MLSKTWFRLLLLAAAIFLLVCFDQTEARGGRGGGGRGGGRGGSRGKGSRGKGGGGGGSTRSKSYSYTKSKSKASKAKKLLTSKKVIGTILVAGLLYHGVSRSRHFRNYPEDDDFYIYIESHKLSNDFMVNGNNYNTRFLLSLDYDVWLNCLIVPLHIRKDQCPATFKGAVKRNTEFYVPSFYSNYTTPTNHSKSEINLCCTTGAGSRCKTSMTLLLSAFLFNYIFKNIF